MPCGRASPSVKRPQLLLRISLGNLARRTRRGRPQPEPRDSARVRRLIRAEADMEVPQSRIACRPNVASLYWPSAVENEDAAAVGSRRSVSNGGDGVSDVLWEVEASQPSSESAKGQSRDVLSKRERHIPTLPPSPALVAGRVANAAGGFSAECAPHSATQDLGWQPQEFGEAQVFCY